MTDPDFSQEAGQVLSSPYFTAPPAGVTGDALDRWWDDIRDERRVLRHGLDAADKYADLADEPKAVYDRARQAIVHAMDAQDALDRINGNGG